jgi:hypothetical protein
VFIIFFKQAEEEEEEEMEEQEEEEEEEVAVWIYLFILNPYQMTIKISFFL